MPLRHYLALYRRSPWMTEYEVDGAAEGNDCYDTKTSLHSQLLADDSMDVDEDIRENVAAADDATLATSSATPFVSSWRHGDWICPSCSYHCYKSREQCKRCGNIAELCSEHIRRQRPPTIRLTYSR